MPQYVQDKSAEVGIKLNNILTALILMVMAWVGFNINSMKESLSQMRVNDALMENEIVHLHETLEQHIEDCNECLKKLGEPNNGY